VIVSKTPLRVSLFGGGTDIPAYYEQHGGLCLSTTIDKYVYVAMNQCVADHVRVIYSKLEQVENFEDLQHDRVREVLRACGPRSHVEVCSFSDIPTYGTGLGSSSTFTVGLLNAVLRNKGNGYFDAEDLAECACEIEIEKCGAPIGKQDQYAAAHGGFNAYYFNRDGRVDVRRGLFSGDVVTELEDNLMLFSTGTSREASGVLEEQSRDIRSGASLDHLKHIREYAERAIEILRRGEVYRIGWLLHQSWERKSRLACVTNPQINEMYFAATLAGAQGGKILGAGGGGYMLLFVPKSKRAEVREAMRSYAELPFKFSQHGSTVTRV